MNDTQIKTLEQVRQFLEGTADVELCTDSKKDRYAWIQTTLVRFHYLQLSKADKGRLLGFLQKLSGYSRIQVKRLIKQYCNTGRIQRRQPTACSIPSMANGLRSCTRFLARIIVITRMHITTPSLNLISEKAK